MRPFFVTLLTTVLLWSCSGCGSSSADDPKVYAQTLIHSAGEDGAKITNVVTGNNKYRNADALWCLATDRSSQDGQIPLLLAVWRKGDQWSGNVLEDGYYEWDLYGCPR